MAELTNMRLISCEGLKERLDREDNLKVVMTYHEWAFRAKHIPGSINIFNKEMATDLVNPDDEIVVYCINQFCSASIYAYRLLFENGFKNIWRFAGGIQEWEEMGFPLEGEDTAKTIEVEDQYRINA